MNYLSKKSGEEVDFLVTEDGKSHLLIEVKTSDDQPSKSFSSFKGHFTSLKMVQIAHKLKVEKTFPNGIEIRNLANWLSDW